MCIALKPTSRIDLHLYILAESSSFRLSFEYQIWLAHVSFDSKLILLKLHNLHDIAGCLMGQDFELKECLFYESQLFLSAVTYMKLDFYLVEE